MTLRILPAADGEMISAALWYEDQRPGLGLEFLADLQSAFEYVNAHASSLSRLEGYAGVHDVRRHLLKRFPYVLVVAQIAGETAVIAISHTRRRPFYWLDRIN